MQIDLCSKINETFDVSLEDEIMSLLVDRVGHENFLPGLDRLFPFFEKYRKAFEKKTIITIGGTNGKGETSYNLYSNLKSQGKKVCVWSSPHVLSLRERFLLSDSHVDYASLKSVIDELFLSLPNESLSFYEFMFLTFCELAYRDDPEIIIFEVGLGGRFDAVNIFNANLTAITSISRDHTELLGTRLKGILEEKFGITRKGVPLFSSLESESLRNHLEELSKEKELPLYDLFDKGDLTQSDSFVERNRTLAKHLTYYVMGNEEKKLNKFDPPVLKGRFEKMTSGNLELIFIGAHNLDGLRKLRDLLLSKKDEKKTVLLSFSRRSSKEVQECIGLFSNAPCLYDEIFVTDFRHQKSYGGLLKSDLDNMELDDKNIFWCNDWKELLIGKKRKNGTKKIIVTGSYYFIGEVQRFLLSHHQL